MNSKSKSNHIISPSDSLSESRKTSARIKISSLPIRPMSELEAIFPNSDRGEAFFEACVALALIEPATSLPFFSVSLASCFESFNGSHSATDSVVSVLLSVEFSV